MFSLKKYISGKTAASKWKTLVSRFNKEITLERDSRKSGAGANQVYSSN